MTTRRKFFEVLGFGGAAAALTATGVASATAIVRKEAAKEKAIKDIESSGNPQIMLSATYGERVKQKITNSEYSLTPLTPQFVPGTRKDVAARLTVGPDGEMYLMTNGKWRRIVTE